MNVKSVEKENGNAKIVIAIAKDTFENGLNKAYLKNRKHIAIPGFRKGKAPRKVIEGMYGAEVFFEDAINELFPEIYEKAVVEQKLNAVGMPSVADLNKEEDGTVVLTIETALYPEVTLGQYKGLEVPKAEVNVTDEEIAAELDRMADRNARISTVDRAAEMGDTLVFDFEGFVDGKPFEGGKAEDYSLEIGSGMFIPGFEDQLVGMEAEKDGEVHVTFPERYSEELAGKDATFKVKIHAVREPQLPELDDEFAKDVSEFDTFAEYKDDVRARLLKNATERSESEFHSELLNAALENMTAAVPQSMVAEKTDEFLRNYAENMGLGGNVSREDVVKMLGLTEDAFDQMMRPTAMRQVQADLLLDAVVKAEGLEATEEEKADFYKKLEEDYGENAEQIKAMIDEKLMARDIERRKAADLIYSSAVKTAPKAEEAPVEENKD